MRIRLIILRNMIEGSSRLSISISRQQIEVGATLKFSLEFDVVVSSDRLRLIF